MGSSPRASALFDHRQRRPLRLLVPYPRACAEAGHEVRVAAPESFARAVEGAGFRHEPFADAPPEVIAPVMARLPTLTYAEADDVVIRDVFARIDARAGRKTQALD